MDNESLLPPGNVPPPSPSTKSDLVQGMPSPKAQSWGAIVSIIIIVLMIIVGAFYSWGKRVSQENVPAVPATAQ